MKSEYEIYMDFQNAMNQAARLRRISTAVTNIATDDIGGTLQAIKGCWTGENADSYLTKGAKVEGQVQITGGDIGKVANTIEAIAERTKNAELAALRIAEE